MAGAAYELLTHAQTESALAEAQVLGLSADDVVKTLIVKTREGYLRAVVLTPDRVDERKLRDLEELRLNLPGSPVKAAPGSVSVAQ